MERDSQKVDKGELGVLVSTVQSFVGHWKLKHFLLRAGPPLSKYDLRFRDAPNFFCGARSSFTIFS
ncbi:hypothetical protein GB937_007350 [Aspergillus fischeri]|nr:hypothetical protein GB937_007350 [Aspergillus fischeri]